MRGAAEYDPSGRMHDFWLGLIVTGMVILVAALTASHILGV